MKTELGKPSITTASSLFADVSIMLVDADHKLAMLAKKVLYSLGCKNIFIVHNGAEALELMKEEQVDLIITEWDLEKMNGIDLTRFLRQSLESPNRMIPVIMLTTRIERADVKGARDIGITEYLIKPFSAKTLLQRVYEIVENPRSFILCKNYIGPDRRRASSLTLPPDAAESRVFIKRRPALVVPKEELKQLILDDQPRIIIPDYTLKKKIGMEVPMEIITDAATVQQSQDVIDHAFKQFMQWISADIKMMEEAYQNLTQSPDNAVVLAAKISEAARSVAGRSGMFKFYRATEVANLLHNFCDLNFDKNNKYHLIIIEKHIQTINAIFTKDIIGEGGDIGAILLKDLAKLTQIYMNRPAQS